MTSPARRRPPMPPDEEGGHEVGYRKPPRHTRFTKGQSGNPRGRRPGTNNLKTLLSDALNEFVIVSENGGTRQNTKPEAICTQLNKPAASHCFLPLNIGLAGVREGKIRRLIINVAPRHLKSLLASIAFPAWCLGHDPSAQILCVSYAQDLADKLARDCRGIMTSPWYRQIFRTRLAPHRQAVQEFITTRQGYRLATSTGGVLTGRGADIILIDDPLKPEEALSEAQRNAANDWFVHTLYSRLNDKRSGAIVIIMQRLHEDDLVGHVLAQQLVGCPELSGDRRRGRGTPDR